LKQWFEGLPITEAFKLYEGQISSPIQWHEGDRTLSFEVVTKLEDKEIGFSPEEGYFDFLPDEAIGQAWPLAFGDVQNVPAVRLSEVPNSLISETLGTADPTITNRLDELALTKGEIQGWLEVYILALAQAEFTADFGDTPEERAQAEALIPQLTSIINQLLSQIATISNDEDELNAELAQQRTEQNGTIEIANGEIYPQGEQVTLQVGATYLVGTFNGSTFDIDEHILTEYDGYQGEPFGYTWYREGTSVTIQSNAPIVYVVNLLPSTVNYIQAYKETESGKILSTVPEEYYTVATTDVGAYTITYVKFSKPLSSFDDTFEDEIYVTLTSTVGPNTVDIIEWLIDTYTDLDKDATSFASVRTKLDNYPSHFALLDRRNILTVLEEIAFQARCSMWISDNTVYLKYLPVDETEIDTITESDIDAGTLTIDTTTTEELVTKLVANWTDDYAMSEPNKIILRHNVKKYGTKEREIDFYIYNISELVAKSATFWLIRFANVWKNINFTTYLHKLAIETFDTVEFDFSQNFVADTAVKGTITSSVYDSDSKLITMSAWLPVKCGTMEVYSFANPETIDVTLEFPTPEELESGLAGGDGPGTEVEGGVELDDEFKATIQFVSRQELRESGARDHRRDYGDRYPSDLDDIKPTPAFGAYGMTPGTDPSRPYPYPDRGLQIIQPTSDAPGGDEKVATYPGTIVSKIRDIEAGDTDYPSIEKGSLYYVNIYIDGLAQPPTQVEVVQLQIEIDVDLPVGTWVIVSYGENTVQEEITDPITGEVTVEETVKDQYIMQVPVWL
jgi:hypothetical protein